MSFANIEFLQKSISIDDLSEFLSLVRTELCLEEAPLYLFGGVLLKALLEENKDFLFCRDIDLGIFRPPYKIGNEEKEFWNRRLFNFVQKYADPEYPVIERPAKDGSIKFDFITQGMSFSISRRPEDHILKKAPFNSQVVMLPLLDELSFKDTLKKIKKIGFTESIEKKIICDPEEFLLGSPKIREAAKNRPYMDMLASSCYFLFKIHNFFPAQGASTEAQLKKFLKNSLFTKESKTLELPHELFRILGEKDLDDICRGLKIMHDMGLFERLSNDFHEDLARMSDFELKEALGKYNYDDDALVVYRFQSLVAGLSLSEKNRLMGLFFDFDKNYFEGYLTPKALKPELSN